MKNNFEMTATQDIMKEIKKTEIELSVINKVKELRKAAKMSQRKLAMELRLSSTYVNRAENPFSRAKYNLNHLNELAKIFSCSIADFIPNPFVQKDTIEEYMDIHPKLRAKYEKMIKNMEEKAQKEREAKEKAKKEKAAMKKKATSKKK